MLEWDETKHRDRKLYILSTLHVETGEKLFYQRMKTTHTAKVTSDRSRATKMAYGEAYGRGRNLIRAGYDPVLELY